MAAEHYHAVFVDTASTPASTLRVKIPEFDGGVGTFEVTWSPTGNALPAAGDRALVLETDDGAWWAVAWWSPAQGAVDLATQAELNAAVAGLPTRIVRGVVAADGSESSPDFSVSKGGTGLYTVTFTTAFAATPVIVLGMGSTSGALSVKLNGSRSASSFGVLTFATVTATNTDAEFTFIACN